MERRCGANATGGKKNQKKGAYRMSHTAYPLKQGFGTFPEDSFYMKISQRESIKESSLLMQVMEHSRLSSRQLKMKGSSLCGSQPCLDSIDVHKRRITGKGVKGQVSLPEASQ